MYCDVSTQFYAEKLVVARKLHKCCECRERIEPGDRYYRCSAKWDGDLWSGCQHVECWNFARSLNGIGADGYAVTWKTDRRPAASRPAFEIDAIEFDDGCIPFCGIGEFLGELHGDYNEEKDEYAPHQADVFWDAMRSGCREVFAGGTGI